MEWSNKWPIPHAEFKDEIFIITDGENYSFAQFVNLCSHNPNCGADFDEYVFQSFPFFIEAKYWIGPLPKIEKLDK